MYPDTYCKWSISVFFKHNTTGNLPGDIVYSIIIYRHRFDFKMSGNVFGGCLVGIFGVGQ